MLNGTNVPKDGFELYWCGTVLGSNGKKQEWGSGVLTPACSIVQPHPGTWVHAHGYHFAPKQQSLCQHPGEGNQKEKMHDHCDSHTGHLGEDGGCYGAQLWAQLTLIPWSAWHSQPKTNQGEGLCRLYHMGLPSLGSTSARKPPAGDRGGDLKMLLMLSWSQSLQVTYWLPTLLVFAHSLVMRKPSAEARERIRFLWIVVRSEVGTLCRQKDWLTGTAPPASPIFSQALGWGFPDDWAHVGSKGPAHPKGSPRPKSHGDGCGV